MDWSKAYGPDADAYPVQPGDVWRVGLHRIACLDLQGAAHAAAWAMELAAEGGCAMAFSDPPWNAGNARSFRTKAGLDGDKGRAVDFADLMARIIGVLAQVVPQGPVWMEMGNASAPAVETMLAEAGWPILDRWPVVYYQTKPCSLIRAARAGAPLGPTGPAGQDEPFFTAFAVARDCPPGQRVFDPCAGRGLTAVTAAQAGRVFRGAELNPRRISVTLAKLARLTDQPAEREGLL
jgi:hypothetical protein